MAKGPGLLGFGFGQAQVGGGRAAHLVMALIRMVCAWAALSSLATGGHEPCRSAWTGRCPFGCRVSRVAETLPTWPTEAAPPEDACAQRRAIDSTHLAKGSGLVDPLFMGVNPAFECE